LLAGIILLRKRPRRALLKTLLQQMENASALTAAEKELVDSI